MNAFEWIPVGESLPEDCWVKCLATVQLHKTGERRVKEAYFDEINGEWIIFLGLTTFPAKKLGVVLAWMELPEAYEG